MKKRLPTQTYAANAAGNRHACNASAERNTASPDDTLLHIARSSSSSPIGRRNPFAATGRCPREISRSSAWGEQILQPNCVLQGIAAYAICLHVK